jgi:diguanylate cyclase (GGDEF)-like protein
MTRVANRHSFLEQLAAWLPPAAKGETKLAVHYVDLDRFKEVNDTRGHASGDAIIKLMAERLKDITPEKDLIARMGGDEFAIAQSIVTRADAEAFAAKLIEALSQPFAFNGFEFSTTASVGTAIAPDDGSDPDTLMRHADLALYRSKADGRSCWRLFAADMDVQFQARLELEERIRWATRNDGFVLHFQPILHLQTKKTCGFEALLRLKGDDGALIPPLTFIPVAEEMGLISEIGAWVIREACRAASAWPPDFTVAVNVSPSQVHAGGLVAIVSAALAAFALKPSQLELEVTEALLLSDTEFVLGELARLKALGVSIVMDDFGTGYSSLSYLWRFKFDKIKIDRSFVRTLNTADSSIAAIIRTIVGLGHSLGMRVTVEGVENADQLSFLHRSQCDLVQGFLFAHPMPEDHLAGHLLSEIDTGRSTAEEAISAPKIA